MSYLRKPPFRRIPGFRSRTPWMMVVAGLLYFIIFISVLAVIACEPVEEPAADDIAVLEEEINGKLGDLEEAPDNKKLDEKADKITEELKPDREEKGTALSPAPSGQLKVHFIDVGQGDSILIQAPSAVILIDGGPRAAGQKVVDYLKQAGISSIDLVISTHPHEDHIGGLISVLESFPIKEVIDPAVAHTTKTFEDYLTLIDEKDIIFTEGRAGMSRDLGGGARMEILHPVSPSSEHLNNASVVARLTFRETSFLFTGDAEEEAEAEILRRGASLKSTVLKAGHHGSRTSSTKEFLQAVAPEVAVIMYGAGNPYGHPHEETLEKLAEAGVQVYRTDLDGTVVIITDGNSCSVEVS